MTLRRKLLTVAATALLAVTASATGDLPALHVQGKQLVDAEGKAVTLHGVMDTPNRYFNSYRWQSWKQTYDESDVADCLGYFEQLFTAITDQSQGAYCDVFRLHLDPCWTNDPTKTSTGENDITAFSSARLKSFLTSLYIPLMEKALAHGLYVVVRPPGVCPQSLTVGDRYQRYLKAVWKEVAGREYVQQHAGQISIELANEPVNLTLADGTTSDAALHDYFQPVVDVIREAGFTGIVWAPGTSWQQNYRGYATHPIEDSNCGYAVHCYPGWYGSGSNDDATDYETFRKQFEASVPVVLTAPIIVTEVDWSPVKDYSTGKQNEWGAWVYENYGTWGTARTSTFGQAFKQLHDHYGNISMTLASTDTYVDMDLYLKQGRVSPAFDGLEEACGKACFNWYKEWKLAQQTAISTATADSRAAIVATSYYNMDGTTAARPHRGLYIRKVSLSDGTVLTEKILAR